MYEVVFDEFESYLVPTTEPHGVSFTKAVEDILEYVKENKYSKQVKKWNAIKSYDEEVYVGFYLD